MRVSFNAVIIILSTLGAATVHAADRYVALNGQTPASPYSNWTSAASNIQDAVNASVSGDTVWVGPGHYTAGTNAVVSESATNVVYFYGKAITLRSSSGDPADTLIDGEGVNRCVWIGGTNLNETPYILDGFTITNGYAAGVNSHSAGIRIYNNNGLLKEAVVQNCVLTDNRVSDGSGRGSAGGLYAGWAQTVPIGDSSSIIVSNCVIRNNSTNGICLNSYATNAADASVIVDCLVEKNWGSGLQLIGGSFVETSVKNCKFLNNVTPNYGGGVNISARRTDIANSLFARNIANWGYPTNSPNQTTGGGAIYSYLSTNLVRNCTIVSNYTESRGSAVYKHWNTQGAMFFWNTIMYFNRNAAGVSDYSMDGGYGYYTNCLSPALPVGGGNVKTPPPVFMDFDGGDYRLKSWSTGVDAGITQEWMSAANDLAGQPRVSANGLVDMGAYETTYADHPGYHVAQDGQTPVPPYTNVLMAASNIQDAVDIGDTNYAVVVLIHPGTYTAPANPTNYGGTNVVFVNKPMTLRSSTGNPEDVIIDGQGVNRGIALVYGAGGKEFVLDGLTITNCVAPTMGGGVLVTDPVQGYYAPGWFARVQNCVIVSNTVVYGPALGYQAVGAYGGGIGCYSRSFIGLVVSNCVLQQNVATNALAAESAGGLGGAIYYGGYGGTATVDRCQIRNNQAYRGGGAFFTGVRSITEDSVVNGNRVGAGSQSFGGGFFVGNSTFRNCLMYDNNSWAGRGAAINCEVYGSNMVLGVENCTITGNTNGGYGVSVRSVGAAQGWTPSLHMVNSIVYSNTYDLSLGVGSEGPPDNYSSYASNSCLGSTNTSVFFGTTNLLYFKGLSTGTFTNNARFADYASKNFRLHHTSPCINTGIDEAWMDGALDLDGNPRISPKYNGTVDMGAYEFPLQSGSIFSVR